MNARFLEKISSYRNSPEAIETMRIILNEKIKRQMQLISENSNPWIIPPETPFREFMLYEARAAHHYWNTWKQKLGGKVNFPGRNRQSNDPVNTLLNVGYHFLVQSIKKDAGKIDMPVELGILHIAQSKKSEPLIYDLMEWLRPLIVDSIVYTHFSKKKKPVIKIKIYDIPKMILKMKKQLYKKFYHAERSCCLKLSYWIRLYLLSFRGAVTEKKIATFHFPPLRHDSRCSKKALL